MVYPLLTGLVHHVKGEVFENSIVPVPIGLGQCRFGHRLGAHVCVITFRLVGTKRNDQISKVFAAAELLKYHDKQLVPTGVVLDAIVAFVLAT